MADPTKINIFGGVLRWLSLGSFVPRIQPKFLGSPWTAGFLVYRGAGYVAGVVTVAGAAAARNVYLFDRLTGALVDRTVSAADGAYRFDGVNAEREYFVLATDANTDNYNAAVADLIVPATE